MHPLLRNALLGVTAAGIGGASAAAGSRLADKHHKKIRESEGDTMTELRKIAQANGVSEDELVEFLFEQGLAKIANDLNAQVAEEGIELTKEAASDFEEALVKVAAYTGFDPEYLAGAIFEHRQELEKVAEINDFVEDLSEDEVCELLKEAAANDAELAGAVAEAEENQENQELAYLAALVDELGEDEAEELFNELNTVEN